jgi:hypothetical protein
MSPHDTNLLLAMLILGFPLAYVFGGPYLWRGFAIIAWLWLVVTYPVAGFIVGMLALLWKPIKVFVAFLVGGYAAGLGFGRATRPRYQRRRAWTIENLERMTRNFAAVRPVR